jgi:hypothetical protein
MRTRLSALALLALSAVPVACTGGGGGGAPAPGGTPLGINLAAVTDYSTELPFTDVFRMSRPWLSQAEGKPWGEGGRLALDPHGWVTNLAPGQFAETLVFTDDGRQAPAGTYTCLYDGRGELEFAQAARAVERRPGRVTVAVAPGVGPVSVRVTRTDPADPLRNLRLLRPDTDVAQPFDPAFLRRWSRFTVLRFMEWQRTNNSKLVRWEDRTKPDDATQAGPNGASVELMVDLANALPADPWFCMPHAAGDDFVRRFARLVKERLQPGRRVYVEFSNECWNGAFAQAQFCEDRGKALGLSTNGFEGQLRYYSQRSVEVFRLWEEEFGGRERLVRVLAAQAANPWTGKTVLDWQGAAENADAVAVAPYFGNATGDPKAAERTAALTVGQLLDACRESIRANRKNVDAYAAEARKRNLRLVAYEGGQHLVGRGGAENNALLTRLFTEANRDAQMADLYREDLEQWRDCGGGLFCAFSSMGRPSKWGSWGVLEEPDLDVKSAPKYRALLEFMDRHPAGSGRGN